MLAAVVHAQEPGQDLRDQQDKQKQIQADTERLVRRIETMIRVYEYNRLDSSDKELLEQINEMGTTIILVTHDPELARRAHRNVHVVDGQISDLKAYESRQEGAAHVHVLRPAGV